MTISASQRETSLSTERTFTSNVGERPNFESCGGILRELDDGHIPETHNNINNNNNNNKTTAAPSLRVDYSQLLKNATTPSVHVFDHAVPKTLVDALYDTTVQEGKPWGTYVTLEQVKAYRRRNSSNDEDFVFNNRGKHQNDNATAAADCQHALSTRAVSHFLKLMSTTETTTTTDESVPTQQHHYQRIPHAPTTTTSTQASFAMTRQLLRLEEEENDASSLVHGVAVWALASCKDNNDRVPYHVDYAEYLRYKYNVLVPPLWAGTLQCSPFVEKGGAFAVQLQGWSHYETYGYKGCKQQDDMGGWAPPEPPSHQFVQNTTTSSSSSSSSGDDVNWDRNTGWVTVPYRYNRCIGHDGTLPHLSAPFVLSSSSSANDNPKRVIVGFNVFGHDIGPFVQEAPEHSSEFTRRVQAMRRAEKTKHHQWSYQRIRANPTLTKWLVLAKREKIKREFREAQQRLDEDVDGMLLEHKQDGVRVDTIVDKLARSDGMWPNAVDVHVHLQWRVRQGILHCSTQSDELSRNDIIYLKSLC